MEKEERSRQLDRKAAEDWAYQVIRKERLRKQEGDEDRRRIVDEREEVRRNEETRKEERSLETGLLARLEALGLCKTEERKKLEKARSSSQVRFTLLFFSSA